jgi:hypothetical protein
MEIIILSFAILFVFIFGFINNMKMKKEIKDLEEEIITNEKISSMKIEELKKIVNEGSKSVLGESKAHIDAALIAISKRIGKRKNPTEGEV